MSILESYRQLDDWFQSNALGPSVLLGALVALMNVVVLSFGQNSVEFTVAAAVVLGVMTTLLSYVLRRGTDQN